MLRESLRVAALGLVLGTFLALAVGRLLTGLLVEVSAADPMLLTLAASAVLMAVLAASFPGALRAGHADPRSALREE